MVKELLEKDNSIKDLFIELVSNFDEDYFDIYSKYDIEPCDVVYYLEDHKNEFIKEYEKNRKKQKNANEYVNGKEFFEDTLEYFKNKCA